MDKMPPMLVMKEALLLIFRSTIGSQFLFLFFFFCPYVLCFNNKIDRVPSKSLFA